MKKDFNCNANGGVSKSIYLNAHENPIILLQLLQMHGHHKGGRRRATQGIEGGSKTFAVATI